MQGESSTSVADRRPVEVEFFYDFGSPWTYLAFTQIEKLVQRHPSATLKLRPFVVGAVFQSVNPAILELREGALPAEAKIAYYKKDYVSNGPYCF